MASPCSSCITRSPRKSLEIIADDELDVSFGQVSDTLHCLVWPLLGGFQYPSLKGSVSTSGPSSHYNSVSVADAIVGGGVAVVAVVAIDVVGLAPSLVSSVGSSPRSGDAYVVEVVVDQVGLGNKELLERADEVPLKRRSQYCCCACLVMALCPKGY